ncbi:hypothetical protein G9A89_011869 [Geosiphon pyriformis]|nr:hypothetical protein G9A89_011869 [Geosiphon pyriformis]
MVSTTLLQDSSKESKTKETFLQKKQKIPSEEKKKKKKDLNEDKSKGKDKEDKSEKKNNHVDINSQNNGHNLSENHLKDLGSKKSKDKLKRKTVDVDVIQVTDNPIKKRKTENGAISSSLFETTDQDNQVSKIEKIDPDQSPDNLQFSSYRLSQPTIDLLKKRGINALFPIQAATFDYIYDGKDVLARAKTGTGKTLAFALPINERLMKDPDFTQSLKVRGRSPRVLVMTPTRDLAKQVASEFGLVASAFKVLCMYGGVPYSEQFQALRDGIDVLVGTPGRVIDHIQRGSLNLGSLKFICLDEADQMLDIGFAEAMEQVLLDVQEHKRKEGKSVDYQTMLFSATVPDWVKETVKKYLQKDYINIDLIGKMDNKTNENIRHIAIRSAWHSRKDIIGDVVAAYAGQGSCVIFCNTKNDANELVLNDKLKQDAQVLHGDIVQSQREVTMKAFREGKFKCIICTDVLARGIDIPKVDLVINCEPPKDVESYVHRSGRTGRAGRPGTAVTFYKSQEEYLIQNIQRRTHIKFSMVGPPQPNELIAAVAQDAIQNVISVNPSVLPYFHQTAQSLIDQKGAIDALSAALAYLTGYANGVKLRSLLSGDEGLITLLFRFTYPIRHVSYVRNMMEKNFPNLSQDSVKLMRLTKDGLGVALDIVSNKVEIGVGENSGIILAGKLWEDTNTTTLEICKELPELLDQKHGNSYGGDGKNSNGRGRFGGGRGNGYRGGGRSNGSYGRGGGAGGKQGNGYSRAQRKNMRTQALFLPFFIFVYFLVTLVDSKEPPKNLQIGIKEQIPEGKCDKKTKNGDTIVVHYTGVLFEDGSKFDSSRDRGDPFKFTLGTGQVIKGWDQGLRGMCIGEKRKLRIPSHLAYGERGSPPLIPANAALVFDVELIGIEKNRVEL